MEVRNLWGSRCFSGETEGDQLSPTKFKVGGWVGGDGGGGGGGTITGDNNQSLGSCVLSLLVVI